MRFAVGFALPTAYGMNPGHPYTRKLTDGG
jgi:hypothetical protein